MTFHLDDSLHSPFAQWLAEHDKTCILTDAARCGAIGGRFTFCFCPNSLGTVLTVKCGCGAEVDLTDYDW